MGQIAVVAEDAANDACEIVAIYWGGATTMPEMRALPATRTRNEPYLLQQNVIGSEAVTSPVGVPPDGVQPRFDAASARRSIPGPVVGRQAPVLPASPISMLHPVLLENFTELPHVPVGVPVHGVHSRPSTVPR